MHALLRRALVDPRDWTADSAAAWRCETRELLARAEGKSAAMGVRDLDEVRADMLLAGYVAISAETEPLDRETAEAWRGPSTRRLGYLSGRIQTREPARAGYRAFAVCPDGDAEEFWVIRTVTTGLAIVYALALTVLVSVASFGPVEE